MDETPSVGCVFCAIVAGDEPASVVHEDDHVLVFMALLPVNPGHMLVVPKRHVVGLDDLDLEGGAHMWRVGHLLARALRRTDLRCEGVDVFLADGEPAGQEVFHTHLHVFPRHAGDSFRIDADWRDRDRADLDADAAEVARALSVVASSGEPGRPA